MKNIKYSFIIFLTLCTGLFLASCTKEVESQSTASSNPKVDSISPGFGSGNDVLTLTGSGLGDIVSIVFDNGAVKSSLNPAFNTNNAVIFRVPDTANGGQQNIVLTNRIGKEIIVPFNVIALVTINSASEYNFTEGSEITLTGNNLADVNKVVLTGTSSEATIVSQSKKELVIKMPAASVNRAKLDITNASGTVTTTQEFVNVDKAFKIFTDDYAPGFQNASWGSDNFISTSVFKRGTASVGKTFAKDNWHQFGFGWTSISNDNYTYLSFWIKGASKDYDLWISTPTSPGGFASFESANKISVPANVWTYFKIPVSTLKLWANGTSFNQIGWRIQGPSAQDETFYLDDIMLVK